MKKFFFKNKILFYNQLIILLYSIFLLSGFNFENLNLYLLLFFFIILFLLFFNNKLVLINAINNNFLLIFFGLYVFLITLFGSNIVNSIKYTLFYFLAFFPPIFFTYFTFSRSIIKILILYIFVLNIIVILNYINNPGIARLMASFPERFYGRFAGWGYPYAFFLVIFSITILNNIENINNKFFFILLLFLNFVVVYFTYSTITTLVLIFCLLLYFLTKLIRIKIVNNKLYILSPFLALIFIFFLFIILIFLFFWTSINSYILNSLDSFKQSSIFWTRVYELFLLLNNSNSTNNDSSISLRIDLIYQTISTISNNIIFGVGWKYGLFFDSSLSYGIGSHNEWFDNFANFGILFGLIINSYYFYFLNKNFGYINIKAKIIYLFSIFLLGLLNPIFSIPFVYGIVFIIPLTINYFNNENNYSY